ncbi:MAG: LysR substrate-binding domain-containing protein, partial [Thiohalorhabdaceae bacterium]
SLREKIDEAEQAREEAEQARREAEQAREEAERESEVMQEMNDHLERKASEYREILRAAADLEDTVRRVATGWETELRVAVDGLLPVEWLYPLLGRFHAEQPQVAVRLQKEFLAGVWEALAEGRADLAIGATGEAPAGGSYSVRPMGEARFDFAASPDHPLAAVDRPLTADDIRPHRAVAVADTARSGPVRTPGLQEGQPVLTVPDMAAKIAAQAAGLGVGHLPRHVAAPIYRDGRLRPLPLADPPRPAPLYLAWRRPVRGRALAWFLEALDPPDELTQPLAAEDGIAAGD